MPKLFISYRRKSWPFTHRLADELAQRLNAEIFVDFSGIDETDFEKAILHHLRASDAVLLVISEHTFEDRIHRDDDWVRREIREALTLDKPIVLVCIDGLLPPPGLPDDIKEIARRQGIMFYPEYFTPAVDKLADFVVTLGAAGRRTASALVSSPTAATADEKTIAGKATLDDALDLLESRDFHKAAFLLESLRTAGYRSRYVDVTDLLQQAHSEAEQADLRQRAQLEYEEVAALAARKITMERARAAFAQWSADYPTLVEVLDSAHLRERFQPMQTRRNVSAEAVRAILGDPFEWCPVPAGEFLYGDNKQKLTLPAFQIAKYPITYRQFEVFVTAADGFRDARWWAGLAQDQSASPGDQKWKTADHPRENVSWYDATAFCRWLSARLGGGYELDDLRDWMVRLPTEFEWEKAARGAQGLAYPYGEKFDQGKGNTVESNLKQTTPVTQYPQGASPYGVLDLSGNVWEWCWTDYSHPASDATSENMRSDNTRVLRGGSFGSSQGYARAAYRDYYYFYSPNSRDDSLGFRVVCRPPSPGQQP